MNIPIELFSLFIGTSIALAIFGFLRNPQIPAMLVFGGMFILTISVSTENIIMGFDSSLVENENIIAEQTSRTGSGNIHNGTSNIVIRAQHIASSSSILNGKTINCLEVYISKTGAPSIASPVILGVFSGTVVGSIAETKYEFGRINITNITTDSMLWKACNESQDYTMILNDRIGIMYRSGDATNFISDQEDTVDTFDGTNSRAQSFNDATNIWANIASNDLFFIMSLEHQADLEQIDIVYEFTEFPKTIFALISVIFMLTGGLMVFTRER